MCTCCSDPLAFTDAASTTVRDLKRAAFQAIGATPDGCEDTFTLDGEGGGPLTADTQALDEAGVNNEATVTVTRRRECRQAPNRNAPLPTALVPPGRR